VVHCWGWGEVLVAVFVAAASPANDAKKSRPQRTPAEEAEDRRAFLQYQAELGRLLANERRSSVERAVPGVNDPARAGCRMFTGEAHRAPAHECLSCHALRDTHPVDLDYEVARTKPGSGLRPMADVVKRGVFLPEGQVRCVTCHEARSRWMYHLALPPGAKVRPAVDPRVPATYENPVPSQPAELVPAGISVSPTPLCKACHTIGE
jgi:hypothetical protein